MSPEDRQRIRRRFVELQDQGYCPSRTSRMAGDRELYVLLKAWSAAAPAAGRHGPGVPHKTSPISAGARGQVRHATADGAEGLYATAVGYGPYDHLEDL